MTSIFTDCARERFIDVLAKEEIVPQYFVYILKCRSGELYTGYTSNPKRRLQQHEAGVASKYTRSRLPVTLVFLERCPSKSSSLRREAEIKKLSHAEKLRLWTHR